MRGRSRFDINGVCGKRCSREFWDNGVYIEGGVAGYFGIMSCVCVWGGCVCVRRVAGNLG